MQRRIIIFILYLFISNVITYANVTFEAKSPGIVLQGDKFQITFSLQNGSASDFKGPKIDGCKLLSDRGVSTFSSFRNVNGKTTSSTRIDYTCLYRAEKTGKFTVPSVSITVDGKSYKSKPITFEIKENSGKPNQRIDQTSNINEYSTSTPDAISGDELFVKIILSKKTAYEQEPIECTIKLYTQYGIESFIPTTQPSFDGFIIEENPAKATLNQVETYNGKDYYTAILKRCILFPQKSGKLTINSGKYDLVAQKYEKVSFGGGYAYSRIPIREKLSISSNSASIVVSPLPQPQPIEFSGAVGEFTIDTKLSANTFRTNETAIYSFKIEGTGNLKYIKEPTIDFPSEFELYTPKSNFDVNIVNGQMVGSATFDYTFIPQSVGKFKIPEYEFTYFDLNKKEYVKLTTKSYTINVGKGLSTSINQQDVKVKNNDILHIKLGDKNIHSTPNFIIYSFWYWIIYFLLICSCIAFIYYYNKILRLNSDVVGLKLAKANKVATKRLKIAKKYMQEHRNKEFYQELLNAILGYLSDKLSIPTSQLLRENISLELSKHGVSEEIYNKIITILDHCEMSSYSPHISDDEVSDIYNDTVKIINEIESIKRKHK